MVYYTRDKDGYVLWDGNPGFVGSSWCESRFAYPLIENDCDFLNPESSGLNIGEIREVVVKR